MKSGLLSFLSASLLIAGHVQAGETVTTPTEAQATVVDVAALPTTFKIANRWSLKVMAQSGDTVVYREFDDNVNDIWSFNVATDTTVEIVNVATGQAMEMEGLAAYPEMSDVSAVWLSQKWIVEAVEDTVFTIRSAWYGHYYLNVEGQMGYVENSGFDPSWWSGQWTLVPVDVEEPVDTTTVDPVAGIFDEVSEGDVSVFPNPSTGLVNVVNSGFEVSQVRVYDALGNVVLSQDVAQSVKTLDLSRVKQGLYFVAFIGTEGVRVSRVQVVK